MPYAKRIVLLSRSGYRMELDGLVEQFLADGVSLVAVAGADCSKIEDIIDELVVGDGSDSSRFLMTSSHDGEALEEVLEFARTWNDGADSDVQLVEL